MSTDEVATDLVYLAPTTPEIWTASASGRVLTMPPQSEYMFTLAYWIIVRPSAMYDQLDDIGELRD